MSEHQQLPGFRQSQQLELQGNWLRSGRGEAEETAWPLPPTAEPTKTSTMQAVASDDEKQQSLGKHFAAQAAEQTAHLPAQTMLPPSSAEQQQMLRHIQAQLPLGTMLPPEQMAAMQTALQHRLPGAHQGVNQSVLDGIVSTNTRHPLASTALPQQQQQQQQWLLQRFGMYQQLQQQQQQHSQQQQPQQLSFPPWQSQHSGQGWAGSVSQPQQQHTQARLVSLGQWHAGQPQPQQQQQQGEVSQSQQEDRKSVV